MRAAGVALALAVHSPARAAETGIASWYSSGRRTASGESFHPDGISCAHRIIRFGTKIRVTDLRTGRSVVCRVNDRGPFIRGRIVDLSRGAARSLGMVGLAHVKLEIVE